jgi:hypothetical protein
MTPKSAEDLEQVCKEICPACAASDPLRYRSDSNEWVHDVHGQKGAFAHKFCLAHNYRVKYRSLAGG